MEPSDLGDERCDGVSERRYLVCGMTWANPPTVTENLSRPPESLGSAGAPARVNGRFPPARISLVKL
jgi:hypothetical protein